jgi:membrane-bound serine protease (ClpP class)
MNLVALFNHPVVSAVLLALAFLGLVAEVRSDGFRRAGWAGLLALLLFLSSHLVVGGSPWAVAVSAVGVGVLWPALADPSRLWSARLGIPLLAAGAFLSMVSPASGPEEIGRAATVLAAATLLVVVTGAILWMSLPASVRPARRIGVFFHVPETGPAGDGGNDPAESRVLPGARGRAATPLDPEGEAVLDGDRVEAVVEGEWVEEGEEVEVVYAEGVQVVVRRLEGSPG